MRNFAVRFVRDEGGTTSIEYALIGVLVAVGIISAVTLLGAEVKATFEFVESAMKKA